MKFSTARRGALASLAFVLCLASWGQEQDTRPLSSIDLEGLERVSDSLIRSQLEVQVGQPMNPRAVSRDLRRLYDLKFFSTIKADVTESAAGLQLKYIFEEKQFIQELRIAGNKKIKNREIRSRLGWKEGDAFAPDGYEAERENVLSLYRSKGFLNATVDIVAEELSNSRMRVTYTINEAKKAKVARIEFAGNTVLSDKKLRKEMKTKRKRWFIGGKYDEKQFEEDLKVVSEKFGDFGRLEAQVTDTELSYTKNGKKLGIDVTVAEGPEYRVKELDVANNNVFDSDELLKTAKSETGEIHNRSQVEEDAETLQSGYRDSGYVDANVTPQVTLDREDKTTTVIQNVEEGQLKYIRDIKITGNNVTKDEVIRRMLLLQPGDRYDGNLLRASQRQLESTEYFDEVRVTLENDPTDERFANLLVDVDEGDTGNFNFGAGVSSTEGLGGFVEFKLNNFDITNWPTFQGGGQQFSTRLNIGEVRTDYNLSFTDPQFLGYPLSFGFDVFDERVDARGGTRFDQQTQGLQLRFAKALSPYNTARTSLRYNDFSVSGFGNFFLSRDLRELRDPGTTIANAWGFNRNSVDSYRDPSSGSTHDIMMEVAGLGGDNDFIKLTHDSSWYWKLDENKKWILSLRTREGSAWTYGDKELVPLNDRFYAGGMSTIRGFDTRDVGPQVRSGLFSFGDKQRIGGELMWVGNVELKYITTSIMRLYGFADAGTVWKTVDDFDFGEIKYSVGLGVGFNVPKLGPVRIDYGFPLNADEDQGSGRLHFSTGFRF